MTDSDKQRLDESGYLVIENLMQPALLQREVRRGDVVLVKASRAEGLERVALALLAAPAAGTDELLAAPAAGTDELLAAPAAVTETREVRA